MLTWYKRSLLIGQLEFDNIPLHVDQCFYKMAINRTTLSDTKDVIIVILGLLTFFVSVLILGWWYPRRDRKEDRKNSKEARQKDEKDREEARQKAKDDREEARQKAEDDREEARLKAEKDREEARLKADAEKIAAVLSKKYDKVEKIFQDFKTTVDKLKEKTINDGFTEFDVLLYMCHPDKWQIFEDLVGGTPVNGSLMIVSDVNKIMKLFIQFRIQLSSIHDKACPEDIKTEFSDEIIKMGETIYPFVSTSRQKIIEKVLIYFGYTGSSTSAAQGTTTPSTVTLQDTTTPSTGAAQGTTTNPEDRGAQPSNAHNTITMEPPHTNQQANERLIPYPGHDVIQRAIPYIEHFGYINGEMSCNITCKDSNIKCLETCVEVGVSGVIENENEIWNCIIELWPQQPSESELSPQDDLLHLIRMVMFKLLDNSNFFDEEKLSTFSENVVAFVNLPENLVKDVLTMNCKNALDDIETHIKNLRSFKVTLENEEVLNLQNLAEQLHKFVKEVIQEHNINVGTLAQGRGHPRMMSPCTSSSSNFSQDSQSAH